MIHMCSRTVGGYRNRSQAFQTEKVSNKLGPGLSAFEADIYSDTLNWKTAISLLEEIFTPFVTMLARSDREKWARFTLREQGAPTKAFETLYASGIGRFFRAVIHMTAIASGDIPASQAARFRGLTLVGQALTFRAARALSLRILEVENLGDKGSPLITASIRENIRLLQYA